MNCILRIFINSLRDFCKPRSVIWYNINVYNVYRAQTKRSKNITIKSSLQREDGNSLYAWIAIFAWDRIGWKNAQRLKDVTKIERKRQVRLRRARSEHRELYPVLSSDTFAKKTVQTIHATAILSYVVARVPRFIFHFLRSANYFIVYSITEFLLYDLVTIFVRDLIN